MTLPRHEHGTYTSWMSPDQLQAWRKTHTLSRLGLAKIILSLARKPRRSGRGGSASPPGT